MKVDVARTELKCVQKVARLVLVNLSRDTRKLNR